MKKRYVSSTLILKIFIGVLLIVSNFMMIHFAKWNVFLFLWLNTLINFAGTHILFKEMLQIIKAESKDIIVKAVGKNTFFDYFMLLMFLFFNVVANCYIFSVQSNPFLIILFNVSLHIVYLGAFRLFYRKGAYLYSTDGYMLDFCLIQGSIAIKESMSSLLGEKSEIFEDSLNKLVWLFIIANLFFDMMIYIEFYCNNQSINKGVEKSEYQTE